MARVRLPDGTVIEAPDNPTPAERAQLQSLMSQAKPEPSAEELQAAHELSVPSFTRDLGKVADVTFRGGLLALPGLIGDFMLKGGRKYVLPAFTGKVPADWPADRPGPSDMLYKMTGGPLSEPESKSGQVVGNIGASAVGAVTGGGPLSIPRRAMVGTGAGVGSETAGALTDDSVIARLLGGIAGGGLTGLPNILRPNAESMIRTSTKGVTDADWRRAGDLQRILNREGISHLNSQLLGPNSSLDDLVQLASGNPQVRPPLLAAVRNTIPETEEAVRRWSSANLPINVNERRGMFADVQGIAAQGDRNAMNAANNAYVAAMPDLNASYAPEYISNLRKELITLAKSDKYGPESAGGKALLRFANEKLPNNEPAVQVPFRRPQAAKPAQGMPIAHLNNLLKDLNVLSLEEGWKGLPVNDLKVILRSYTPEFNAARTARTSVMEGTVTPYRQGLAGQIALMGGGPSPDRYTTNANMVRLVFPPDKPQAAAITKLASDLGAEPVGWLLRDHLEQSLQAAARSESPRAPADFVKAVAGNTAQRANLEAGLFAVAKEHGVNPFAVRNGFYQLMTALKTFGDVKIAGGINSAEAGFEAGKNLIGGAVAPASRIGRWSWSNASTKTYQQIADLVTSKDGLAKLEAIGRSPEPQMRQALIAGILTNTAVANPRALSPHNTRE